MLCCKTITQNIGDIYPSHSRKVLKMYKRDFASPIFKRFALFIITENVGFVKSFIAAVSSILKATFQPTVCKATVLYQYYFS